MGTRIEARLIEMDRNATTLFFLAALVFEEARKAERTSGRAGQAQVRHEAQGTHR